jgi:multidrug efflux pump subunit AcrA (membrane-fusion protein)
MLRKKAFWVILIVVVFATSAVLIVVNYAQRSGQGEVEPPLQTATVRRGDIVIIASGSGQVVSAAEIDVGFNGGGEITDVFIEIGDHVEAGQVLVAVDDTSAMSLLAQAEANLRELTSPAAMAIAQQSLAIAQMAVEDAYDDLAYLISPSLLLWERNVAIAHQALLEAQAAAEADSSQEASQALTEAEEALEQAQAQLDYFQQVYEAVYLPDTFTFTYTDRTLGSVTYYDPPSDYEIAEARAVLALAEARVDEAAALLAIQQGEMIPTDASGPGLVKLEQAINSVESARLNLKATELVAPISGTVTSLSAIVGQTVGSAPILTISVLEPPMLQIYLDEMDLANIAVGYVVEAIFDALPDSLFIGHVVQVDPKLIAIQGVSTVRGLVELDEATSGDMPPLPIGMNAAVDVIAAEAEEVLLVPIEALRELEPGVYAVFVMQDGEPRLNPVTVGLMDYAYAEIQSGLEVGDVVTTGIVETE